MLIDPSEVQKVANMFFNAIHEEEVEIINQLYDALLKGDVKEADRLMDELLVDIEDHFGTEEDLMREANFFGYPMHKAEHDQMRKEFKGLYDSWKETKDTEMVKRFLEDRFVPWLKLHIAQWDSVTAMHIGD